MEILVSIFLGIGLAAACGFRIFVPMLVMSIAAQAGMLQLSGGFEWIGSLPALIVFALATLLEIGAYYIPWVDNLLDSVASPAAVIAGIVVAASVITDLHPMLQWGLALIAGGGAAGTVQAITTGTRGVSTVTTAGFGNFAVSTAEAGGSVVLSVLAVLVPVAAFLLLLGFTLYAGRRLAAWRASRRQAPSPSGATSRGG